LLQNTYISILTPKLCVYKCPSLFQNSHSWEVPWSPSTWINKTKQESTRIQNSNHHLFNGLFLFVMPCKSQKQYNLFTPLTEMFTPSFTHTKCNLDKRHFLEQKYMKSSKCPTYAHLLKLYKPNIKAVYTKLG